jgi:hypothetical protein
MFGNAITDGAVVSTGTYGYIVRFAVGTQEVNSVLAIQMQNAAGTPTVLSAVVKAAVDQSILAGYPELITCPDLAFCLTGQNLDVFLKTATYPYAATNRLGFWFYRDGLNVALAGDKIDVPQEARELFKLMSLREGYVFLGKNPQYDIEAMIDEQKQLLGL